eukprot:6887467-Alexandrium_andersonii.AAC.1
MKDSRAQVGVQAFLLELRSLRIQRTMRSLRYDSRARLRNLRIQRTMPPIRGRSRPGFRSPTPSSS